MNAEPPANHRAQAIWQQQPLEAFRPSIEDLRSRAARFERQVRWRNAREYGAAAVAAACVAVIFWRTPDALTRVGAALNVAGLFCIAWQLHVRGSARRPPADFGRTTGIEFLKQDLARQRDLLRGVWRWYLGPLVPGFAVLLAGAAARAGAETATRTAWAIGATVVVIALVLLGVWRLNVRAAKRLQARLDELDDIERDR
jgi:Flp pilus assembly protein TadB